MHTRNKRLVSTDVVDGLLAVGRARVSALKPTKIKSRHDETRILSERDIGGPTHNLMGTLFTIVLEVHDLIPGTIA